MKLDFVSPRYGLDIVGGAEYAIRMLAENSQRYANVDARVLTTTAGDERTWSKAYEPGSEEVNNVIVNRYLNDSIDRQKFDQWSQTLLMNPTRVSDDQFEEFIVNQGPYSVELLQAIEESDADAIVFHPMLSSPAAHGIIRAKRPVVLHPALHNERLSYMPGYEHVMRKADLLSFSTRSEQDLANEIYNIHTSRQRVFGFGVDEPQINVDIEKSILSKYSLDSKSYAIVIGRVDKGKGSDLVYTLFNDYKSYINDLDSLVFVGPKSESSEVEANNNIFLTGSITDEEKWILLSNARCLISPSVTESFSLVVLEAMSLGIPVLVNGTCGPTLEHVDNSRAGAYFNDASTFVAGLNVVSQDSKLRDSFVEYSKLYVKNNYSWSVLIKNYIAAVEETISSFV